MPGESDKSGRDERSRSREQKQPEAGTLGELAKAMREALRAEGVATRTDIEGIRKDIDGVREETNRRITAQDAKLEAQEKRIEDMHTALAAIREDIGRIEIGTKSDDQGRATGHAGDEGQPPDGAARGRAQATNGAETTPGEWQPRQLLLRGFAPFGCKNTEKLGKAQYNTEVKRFIDMLPEHLKNSLTVVPPFVVNFQIGFRLAKPENGRRICDVWNNEIEARQARINGKTVRAVAEMSPDRKTQYRTLYKAIEEIQKENIVEDKYTVCYKGLKIYATETLELAGAIKAGTGKWERFEEGAKAMGMRWEDNLGGGTPAEEEDKDKMDDDDA